LASHHEIAEAVAGRDIELAATVNKAITVAEGSCLYHPLVWHIEISREIEVKNFWHNRI
jgi:hypothetical protein